ncbi:MAG: toll/interleukin-1 receptor domain-containing protein [Muribaculaceae bacterium]|nr:toll/interleukin-1 receptor domain-containing protein [Muribaculaceae bacterium]
MKYDIFISYKRKSLATANNLYYRLTTRGYSSFFDLEEMRRDNFNEQIYNYIKNSKDVFIILEEGSLDACKTGNWEKDWFCKEISFALQEGKNIIPILLNGYQMPDASFFPDELKELSLKNAPEFSFSFFDEYIDRLIEKDYITAKPQINEGISVFKFYSNADCSVTKDGKLVCSIEGNNDEPYYLPIERNG